MSFDKKLRPGGRRAWRFAIPALISLVGIALVWGLDWQLSGRSSSFTAQASASRGATPGVGGDVGCLGHIEPENGILQVTSAYFQGHPQRVLALEVNEGDQVKAGQLLATLDGKRQLESAVSLADAHVALQQARLAQVSQGASASEIAVQKTIIRRADDALAHSRSDFQRYQSLKSADVAPAQMEELRLRVSSAEQTVEEATQRLNTITTVRPADIAVVQSELAVAVEEARNARLNLKSAFVYAPVSGRVVRILAYPGEEAGAQGLLEIGRTASMYVVAEVYETDVARVHTGETATITSDLFSDRLSGVVERVGTTLSKADVLPTDPVAFADARVFKVWIRLDNSARAGALIHGKVNVVIHS